MSCLTSAQRGAIQCWTPADLEPYREYPALDLHLNLFTTAQLYQLSPNSNCPDIPQSLWMNAKSLLKRILHQKTFYRPDLIFWIVMVKSSWNHLNLKILVSKFVKNTKKTFSKQNNDAAVHPWLLLFTYTTIACYWQNQAKMFTQLIFENQRDQRPILS